MKDALRKEQEKIFSIQREIEAYEIRLAQAVKETEAARDELDSAKMALREGRINRVLGHDVDVKGLEKRASKASNSIEDSEIMAEATRRKTALLRSELENAKEAARQIENEIHKDFIKREGEAFRKKTNDIIESFRRLCVACQRVRDLKGNLREAGETFLNFPSPRQDVEGVYNAVDYFTLEMKPNGFYKRVFPFLMSKDEYKNMLSEILS